MAPTARGEHRPPLSGVIFDIDGVLVDSPHEGAWRDSLRQLMEGGWSALRPATGYDPERFTYAFYHEVMAGKPRLAGARAALEAFGVPDAERRAVEYAGHKQRRVVELIAAGEFSAYPDAMRFLLAVKRAGLRIASASSSKNSRPMLERIRLDDFAAEHGLELPVPAGQNLLDVFDADVTGRDFPRGKPDPTIFLTAAAELGLPPESCVVIEDAPAGIEAARAGGMAALAVARRDDAAVLQDAGADLIVDTLDEVDAGALAHGRLEREARVKPR